ncbi:pectin esterase [Parabacteroides sp. 52]|uniref:pectinesterase family protein n=1 Tax=unclassified Parabacteroides TaxID=2649774 RepID=UPI0013D54AB3|nr:MULTISPECIES: pectinesterase family protein [unclassified Parabacteroides]MDH6534156.1 pectinesterase [Parabacteroides sp. PM5-20]NDV54941.1 pectin esterase [Parabacteroides sp. 52]
MHTKIGIYILLLLPLLAWGQKKTLTIHTIGDSTMADKKWEGQNPERGWGQMLPAFFTEEVRVENHAVNGRSTKSFIDEGRWETVVTNIKPGDYVFIQFGHNDQKTDAARHTDPETTFKANLKRFVQETRDKGGYPVLFTSIVRRHFDEKGKLIDSHGLYPEATRKVADSLHVPLIDLNRLTHTWIEACGDIPSRDYFMWVAANTIPALPEGKEDNTHLNINGARQVAGIVAAALEEGFPAFRPYLRTYDWVVAQDGSGDFFTVQEALAAVPDYRKEGRTRILIRKGVYKEKLIIPESKINLSLFGEKGTILTFDDYAQKKNRFGENKSTSGSATCYFYADNLYAEQITFQNTSGPVGQAVAVLVAGDRSVFRKCRFLGFQDTLYTYSIYSRQYYEDCYVEGSVDFIFGWSTAVFHRCTIHSNGNGYITAPGTPQGHSYGYVFFDCTLTAAEGIDKVYLSRPWRNHAQAVFIRCHLGKHILPAGWHNWNKKEAEQTIVYAEYLNTGEGASPETRVPYARQLSDLHGYTIEQILAGKDNWNPLTDPQTLLLEKR